MGLDSSSFHANMPDNLIFKQQQRNKIYEKKQSRQSLCRHKLSRKKKILQIKSHLKQQWTTVALAITMKVVYSKEKSVMWQLSRQSFSRQQLNRKTIL